MNFCVVEFTETGDMLVVHNSWITLEDKVYCPPYWSQLRKLRKAIENSEVPNTQTWKLYDARVLHRSKSFDDAHRALKQAETANTSEIGLEMPLGRGFRQGRASKRVSEHETSEEESHTPKSTNKSKEKTHLLPKTVIKTPPSFPQSRETKQPLAPASMTSTSSVTGSQISLGPEESFDNASNDLIDLNFSADSDQNEMFSNLGHTPRHIPYIRADQAPPPAYDSGILRHILKKLAVINAKLDDQGDMLATLLSSQSKRHVEVLEGNDDFDLPCELASDLQAMEAVISNDKAARARITALLAKAGGSSVNDTTYRTLERLMSDDLAMSFSWAGQSGKQPFKDLIIMKIVRDAVKMNPMAKNPTDFEIEKAIKYWLKRAKSRISALKPS